jgi:hypothetical protein
MTSKPTISILSQNVSEKTKLIIFELFTWSVSWLLVDLFQLLEHYNVLLLPAWLKLLLSLFAICGSLAALAAFFRSIGCLTETPRSRDTLLCFGLSLWVLLIHLNLFKQITDGLMV